MDPQQSTPEPKNIKTGTLFRNLTQEELDYLDSLAHEIHVNVGMTIVHEGEQPLYLYVVKSGAVEVIKTDPDSHSTYQLSVLRDGDMFGEVALLDQNPRSASVRAIEPSVLLAYPLYDMQKLIEEKPLLYTTLLKNLGAHLSTSLRTTNEMTVLALREELALTKSRIATGRFLVYNYLVWSLYTLTMSFANKVAHHVSDTAILNFPMMVFYVLCTYVMMRYSGYPLSYYGLTLKNWRPAVIESLIWSFLFMVGLTLVKYILIKTIPSLDDATLIDLRAGLNSPKLGHGNYWLFLLILLLYALHAPLQEIVFRGAIQSTLQNFLVGKYRIFLSIITTTSLFCVAHIYLSFNTVLIVLLPSLLWGVLYARQKTLMGVFVSHILIGWYGFFVINIESVFEAIFPAL